MKKLRLKKWVKNVIAYTTGLLGAIILIHLFWTNLIYVDNLSNQCDLEYGHTCSSYELRNYSIRGN